MILKSVTIRRIGPFEQPIEIDIDPIYTVLTGANDVGKTVVLRSIARFCKETQTGKLTEQEVNNRYRRESAQWSKDPSIEVKCTFASGTSPHLYLNTPPNWIELTAIAQVGPDLDIRQITEFTTHDGKTNKKIALEKAPHVIWLPRDPDLRIRDVVDLASPTLPERELLELAFDMPYSATTLQQLSEHAFLTLLAEAEERLNERLSKLFPEALRYRVQLRNDTSDGRGLAIILRDPYGSATGPMQRGAGAQRLLAQLGVLLKSVKLGNHVILLVDEPENSLHADAQHMLRRILEDLAASDFVQVVCSTHSPLFINSLYPERVRLLARKKGQEMVSSVTVIDRPFEHGFQAVREELGVLATDTLFVAPVTLLVEGGSERIALPMLIRRLADSSEHQFENSDQIFSRVGIWDTTGDNIGKCAALALSLGAKIVVLRDGDKREDWTLMAARRPSLKGIHPVFFPNAEEFEDIFPIKLYIDKVRESIEESYDTNTGKVTLEEFESWRRVDGRSRVPVTKQVIGWLASMNCHGRLDKIDVAHRCAQAVEVAELRTETLRQLKERVVQTLDS